MGYRFRLRGIKFMAILVMLCTYYEVLAQPETVKKFWYEVKLRREYKLMPVGLNAWLGEIAKGLTNNSYSEASALLENIHKEKPLQDRIFLEVYCNNYASKESLRYTLANLCGSYSIGNPVSDYIITTYSKDKRAIEIIHERQEEVALKERKIAIRDSTRENERIKKAELDVELEKQKIITKKQRELESDLHNRAHRIRTAWANDLTVNDTIPPKFKGGIDAWDNYLQEKIIEAARTKAIDTTGRMFISFRIDKKGDVTQVYVLKGLHKELDQLATDVITKSTGRWIPAKFGSFWPVPTDFTITWELYY